MANVLTGEVSKLGVAKKIIEVDRSLKIPGGGNSIGSIAMACMKENVWHRGVEPHFLEDGFPINPIEGIALILCEGCS